MVAACTRETQPKELPESQTIPILTRGDLLDFESHLVHGKVNLFDLYAVWCAPCTRLEKTLQEMQSFYGQKMVVFRADIVSFDSPLARQQQVKDLPYLVAYDETGKLLARGQASRVLPQLLEHLNL